MPENPQMHSSGTGTLPGYEERELGLFVLGLGMGVSAQ